MYVCTYVSTQIQSQLSRYNTQHVHTDITHAHITCKKLIYLHIKPCECLCSRIVIR